MMADAETGFFEHVVVKDISRFSCNTVDLLQNIRTLKQLNIETEFLTANTTSKGNSKFVYLSSVLWCRKRAPTF